MKDKPERDFNIIFHINEHFNDIAKEIEQIKSLNQFINDAKTRKSILFDLFQIGELLNHLSDSFKKDFGESEILSVISVRNKIVHGYGKVNDSIIFQAFKYELPDFIKRLNSFSKEKYQAMLKMLVGKRIQVLIDSDSMFYTERLTNLNGAFQKVISESDSIILKDKTIHFVSGIKFIDEDCYLVVE